MVVGGCGSLRIFFGWLCVVLDGLMVVVGACWSL